jgi:hypothetical protein
LQKSEEAWLPISRLPRFVLSFQEIPMSRISRNFVVAYVLLVGLPLLALAAVLHKGRKLTAPLAVDGTWDMQVVQKDIPKQGCAAALATAADSSLQISQSGKNILISLANSRSQADGSLDGTTLKASGIVPSDDSPAACGRGQSLTLTATVDAKSEPRSLTGFLSVNGCHSCTPAEFRAILEPRPALGGSR